MANEKQYCDRMSSSVPFTTKKQIPEIIKSHKAKSILDVGCADGRFTEYIAEMLPKKIKIDAIDPRLHQYRGTGSDVSGNISFKTAKFDKSFVDGCRDKYDCIVFSSVMHEISSYCENDEERFSKKPIKNAIELASKILAPNGIVIVRDMIRPAKFQSKSIPVEFCGLHPLDWFFRYVAECPYYQPEYDQCDISKFMCYDSGRHFIFNIREDVLMEFLMTFTWGVDSFYREIREKKFIMEKNDWKKAFEKSGMTISSYFTTAEQYPKYFEKIVRVLQDGWKFPDTTCLIVAEKKQ